MARPPLRTSGTGRSTTASPIPQATHDKIKKNAATEAAKRLGLTAASAEIERDVTAALDSAIAGLVTQTISESAQEALRGELGSALPKVQGQVAQLKSLAQSNVVKESFEEQAKLHKMKFDAYKAAGFSDDQSFKLLEIEIRARTDRGF